MSEPKPSHTSDLTAKTQKLPAIKQPGKEDSAEFLAQQEEVRQMIAADVPLTEILSKLVLIIESQAPDMLSSILLLSEDGNEASGDVLSVNYDANGAEIGAVCGIGVSRLS